MMNKNEHISLKKGIKIISQESGILTHIMKLPRFNYDPKLISYGIWPCDTKALLGAKYGGRSSGCSDEWKQSILGTIGETVERYCCVFYNADDLITASYKDLKGKAIHPSEFALFHEKQYEDVNFPFTPFDEECETIWVPCIDLVNGQEVYYPGEMVYTPWVEDVNWLGISTSTGLAAHTNLYKAILTGLYEVIERDSFVITWSQKISAPKIKITQEIQDHIDQRFPKGFEFHFIDITYDLEVPTVFGFCFGEAEYGKFVAVGTAARSTYADALKKVIVEIGQAVPYFRYLLEKKEDWYPTDFDQILSFEDHSVFYLKRTDLLHVFDTWRDKAAEKEIDFFEEDNRADEEKIKSIISVLDANGCNVLLKDITTPDVKQVGFISIKVLVPQLIQMSGAYPYYFLGGSRLYDVPKKVGYPVHQFEDLNKYPHPFP